MAVAQVKVIEEPMPFGDVALAPSAATGRTEAELARAIMGLSAPPSPDAVPRTARLSGVGALMRRTSRPTAQNNARKRAA